MGTRSPNWRESLGVIIFEADTRAGKAFDVALLIAILLSVAAVLLESVGELQLEYGPQLRAIEWFFTILFTIEYLLRLITAVSTLRYAFSFFGIVDFVAIVPTYLSLIIAGTQSLIVIRALRLLRIFRVLKLAQFVGEARALRTAIRASGRKITVFLGTVLTLVLIIGALMYMIEGGENGFTSIPKSIYWAIVTMTTVGYGDLTPQTVLGRLLASAVMIIGYGIIAVPTGIVTVELATVKRGERTADICPGCGAAQHDGDASYCKHCGHRLAR